MSNMDLLPFDMWIQIASHDYTVCNNLLRTIKTFSTQYQEHLKGIFTNIVLTDNCITHYLCNRLHRDNDQPAIIDTMSGQ